MSAHARLAMTMAMVVVSSASAGTCLLIAAAFFRRWRELRYALRVHTLRRHYRPGLERLLVGATSLAGFADPRELPPASLEALLDPLFTNSKLSGARRERVWRLCAETGLIREWEKRVAGARPGDEDAQRAGARGPVRHARQQQELRAKSIRNLGILRHAPSWPILLMALDDPHPDIRLAALQALGRMATPVTFPPLLERLQAAVLAPAVFPPAAAFESALSGFELACAPHLMPLIRGSPTSLRLAATRILKAMIDAEAGRAPGLLLEAPRVPVGPAELVLGVLSGDADARMRSAAGEIAVDLADRRALGVLRKLLLDGEGEVRRRVLRALAGRRQRTPSLLPEIGDRLSDTYWEVRKAAAQALLALGPEGKQLLYERLLTAEDPLTRRQIVEAMEETGSMSALVADYGAGAGGLGALALEQLATTEAPSGLAGVIRSLDAESARRFVARFLEEVQSWIGPATTREWEGVPALQEDLGFAAA